MNKENNTKQNQQSKKKPLTNPSNIKGKIEVTDTRERRDGPGGN